MGADRTTAAPGAVGVTVLWGRKRVVPLLLRPRLHELHHRAVAEEAEKMEDAGWEKGKVALPPNSLVTSLNE